MAVGIIYNAARIALSERAWELASLRVLGRRGPRSQCCCSPSWAPSAGGPFHRRAHRLGPGPLMMRLMASDSIDFPVVIEPSTYASAALIVLAAGVVSALLVRRQIDRLDLVSVLKVRE
jgi:putative ABC transport system permease protein